MKKILLVEDDTMATALVGKFLEQYPGKEGISLDTAGKGAIALEKSNVNPPDIILLDVQLPDGPGTKFIPAFKKINPDCVIIMLTGDGSIDTVQEATAIGAWDYLSKPIDREYLFTSIDNAMDYLDLSAQSTVLK